MTPAHADDHDPPPDIAVCPSDRHFTAAIGPDDYARWLSTAPPKAPAALCLRLPERHALPRGAGAAALLAREIALLRAWLGRAQPVDRIAWQGGTTDAVGGLELCTLMAELHTRFRVARNAAVGMTLDPRRLTPELLAACRASGVNRASLAVGDLDPAVADATGGPLGAAALDQAIHGLRAIDVATITIALAHGLPGQTADAFARTIDAVAALQPDRVVVSPAARPRRDPAPGALAASAAARLQAHGFAWIGPDHFARPADALAAAARRGRLHRGLLGYSCAPCMLTVGLGPGATGALPQGFVRNAAPGGWAAAIARGRLGTAGGLALDDDDRLRAAVVERLMCELAVDLAAMARAFRRAPAAFAVEKAALLALAAEGLVVLEGDRLRLTPQGRPALARVAAVFDRRPRTAVAAAAG